MSSISRTGAGTPGVAKINEQARPEKKLFMVKRNFGDNVMPNWAFVSTRDPKPGETIYHGPFKQAGNVSRGAYDRDLASVIAWVPTGTITTSKFGEAKDQIF